MTPDDVDVFREHFEKMAAYFPYCKVEKGVVFEGYFIALMPLPLDAIPRLFTKVIQDCRFFPTVNELLTMAQTLYPPRRPVNNCPRCPAGHGIHAGHKVSHYPAGPWCDTCNADMPTPAGYLDMPPAGPRHDSPLQLPEYSQTPLRQEEVQEVIRGVMDMLDKKSERLRGMADWDPIRDEAMLTRRREALRLQAQELRDEEN